MALLLISVCYAQTKHPIPVHDCRYEVATAMRALDMDEGLPPDLQPGACAERLQWLDTWPERVLCQRLALHTPHFWICP